MPEKTKLEDYANMNITGFAFIDLNEELKNTIKHNQTNGFLTYYANEKENFNYIDTIQYSSNAFEIKNLYKKMTEIYESKKSLIVKVKFDVKQENVEEGTEEHIFYDTIVKSCSLYKENDEYIIIMNVGSTYSVGGGEFTNKGYYILKIIVSNEKFEMKTIYKGV